MSNDEQRNYLRSFAVLVETDDPSAVSVIPGAQNGIMVELTLKKYGLLGDANQPGLVGDKLKLHFNREKALELANQILAQLG